MAFKMKGFPGINSKGYNDMKDGRSKSAAFQRKYEEPVGKKRSEPKGGPRRSGRLGPEGPVRPEKPTLKRLEPKGPVKPEGTKPLKKDDIVQKNKQKQFNKKVNDLRGQWRNLKDRNSNKAKQLKKEASKIGLSLDESFSTKNTHAGH